MSEKPIRPMNGDETGCVIGYMDMTDFECELGAALGGNRIFPSIEDARRCKAGCIEECGIVEVEVRFRRIVQPSHYRFMEKAR